MVFHDGSLARAPIAPVEVQGYVHDAKLRMAELARCVWRDDCASRRRTTGPEPVRTGRPNLSGWASNEQREQPWPYSFGTVPRE
jgi:hypothetical protein